MAVAAEHGRNRDRWRRFPPLMAGFVALALAGLVLPSSLSLPQTNPSQTLEYAPVPPTDDAPPAQTGDLSSLGLASSGCVSTDTVGGLGPGGPPPPAPPAPGGTGGHPRNKHCVGSPPRQTEDPLAPPCVAYFEGDNFGATAPGVTKDEIRILFYVDGVVNCCTDRGAEDETEHNGQLFDLAKPADSNESWSLRTLRRFQRVFNDRYQTYNRRAHFYAFFSNDTSDNSYTPETRRADAAESFAKVHPFAVLTSGMWDQYEDSYVTSMAAHNVLVFGSRSGARPASFYSQYPGRIWSFLPTLEQEAKNFGSYICRQVVGKPAVDTGDGRNGQPRKLGLLSSADPGYPNLKTLAKLVRKQVLACGGKFEIEATFPQARRTFQTGGDDKAASYAAQNMARFQQAGVTTVIWPGGYETDQSRAAAQLSYYPEWITFGDGDMEGNSNETYQNQTAWDHAWVVTPQTRYLPAAEQPCTRAVLDADPTAGSGDIEWACVDKTWYPDIRQLFTGIQVAGPRLTPKRVDEGFHAIPAVPSSSAVVPACYYDPGDYTCVKDMTAEQWDPSGTPPDSTAGTGCWRMVEAGRRYVAGSWPAANITARMRGSDPCNGYNSIALYY
jgi:hypothetical protein